MGGEREGEIQRQTERQKDIERNIEEERDKERQRLASLDKWQEHGEKKKEGKEKVGRERKRKGGGGRKDELASGMKSDWEWAELVS